MSEFTGRLIQRRYQLLAKIGAGGMGVVYRGVDSRLGRPVAVKMLRVGLGDDEQFAQRFINEAKIAAAVRSNHVVSVHDFGKTESNELFLVMEYLDGVSLSDLQRKLGRLPASRACHIGIQICRALAAAHDCQVVHRDLKPANVMLVERDGDPDFVKVLDFGIAKLRSEAGEVLTQTGMLIGTSEYMAPELILGRPPEPQADIYSLGVLLYRVLTGTRLFHDTGDIAFAHLHLAPTPMSERAPGATISPALEAIVLRCLEKEPKRRFASMEDVADALEAFLAGTGEMLSAPHEAGPIRVAPDAQTRTLLAASVPPATPVTSVPSGEGESSFAHHEAATVIETVRAVDETGGDIIHEAPASSEADSAPKTAEHDAATSLARKHSDPQMIGDALPPMRGANRRGIAIAAGVALLLTVVAIASLLPSRSPSSEGAHAAPTEPSTSADKVIVTRTSPPVRGEGPRPSEGDGKNDAAAHPEGSGDEEELDEEKLHGEKRDGEQRDGALAEAASAPGAEQGAPPHGSVLAQDDAASQERSSSAGSAASAPGKATDAASAKRSKTRARSRAGADARRDEPSGREDADEGDKPAFQRVFTRERTFERVLTPKKSP